MVSDKRIEKIIQHAKEYGDEQTLKAFAITLGTLVRYRREYKEPEIAMNVTLRKISAQYTEAELKAIAKGGRLMPGLDPVPIINFDGDEVCFLFFTDPHMGSNYFKEEYYFGMLEEARMQKVEFGVCAGDVTHGMDSRKPDLLYDLTHIGYELQKEYAINMLSQFDKPLYIIDGNHDRWYLRAIGAVIVKDICEAIPNAHFLGHDEGDLSLAGDVVIKLWHGEDGASYATSYRLQKLVESLTGGEKPHILLSGHTHKQGYFFDRHVHVVSGGALSTQQKFMRRRRLVNHAGFWIIRCRISNNSVNTFTPTWYPFYA